MLLKLLFTALVILVVWAVSKRHGGIQRKVKQKPNDKMVKCVICGLYLPENEAAADAAGEYRCAQRCQDNR
ncbi:MAG: PP0621 family protein [Pseudomonadota bacterium]